MRVSSRAVSGVGGFAAEPSPVKDWSMAFPDLKKPCTYSSGALNRLIIFYFRFGQAISMASDSATITGRSLPFEPCVARSVATEAMCLLPIAAYASVIALSMPLLVGHAPPF